MKKSLICALICAPFSLGMAIAAPNNTQLLNESVTFEAHNGELVPVISTHLVTKALPYKAKGTTPARNSPNREKARTASSSSHLITHNHFIYPDESYVDAINRWLKRDNITHLAWAVDDLASSALNSAPTGTVSFEGTTLDVVNQLSRQLGVPFYLALDNYHHRAAIHQWHNREVQIAMVGGVTLKETIRKLTLDYDWQWVEGENNQSWLAANDYPVSIAYPIVTPKGDLKRALQIVLDGYPVSARLLEGSHTLFIVDTQ
ncbi:hypothetical protein [Shewanella colwelliana]|uniref:hypothetical protein n=1 Tax=Shewanella colwelliana TaxID=23 RepID=UPI0037370422